MILCIDIGNTTTNFGVYERNCLKSSFAVATQPFRTADEVTLQLKALAQTRRLHLRRTREIVICSVVPRMTARLVQALRSLGAVPLRVVGTDLEVPLENRYRYPEQVGHDRLVGAYAAWRHYQKACIVVDLGTAITLDLVSQKGEYLGGIIAPGMEVSLEALAARTALLPKVELGAPPELLGRDTANSIRSGVFYGCAALCQGLVMELKRDYAPRAMVVATGGSAQEIKQHVPAIKAVMPNLVLDGLHMLAKLGEASGAKVRVAAVASGKAAPKTLRKSRSKN